MECLGVITYVDKPTNWVSSITKIQKANGELHLYFDLCDLNEAITHDPHKTLTVEGVAHEFKHSHYSPSWIPIMDTGWSSLIRNPAYSQPSTLPSEDTISCIFPLALSALKTSSRRRFDQILEECQGCIRITGDITVHGYTKAEHNACLWNLMWVACKCGLVFNPQKTHVKAPAINFFDCLYDADGVHLDPDKVDAIHALPGPTNVTELQELLGMVMYLSPFIPGLSTLTAPLCELLKKDTYFTWNCTYDATFQHVKDAVVSDTTLWYFDPSLPVTIQVDVSQVSLGAVHCLCQQGPHQNWMSLCQHRKRDACCHLQSREIQNLHLW